MKTKTKTKPKSKTKPAPSTGHLWAVRTRKTKTNAWMPDEVVVVLHGEPKGRLLMIAGWSITPDAQVWPEARVKANLDQLIAEWAEDCGKTWRLEWRG